MSINVFAYGSLTFPEVMEVVSGDRYQSAVATLQDYRRAAMIGKSYPAIFPQKSSKVEGRIFFNVGKLALARIDYFEDGIYDRLEVTVSTISGRTVSAEAYILPTTKLKEISDEPWNADEFQKRYLDEYLHKAKAYMATFVKIDGTLSI